MDSSHKEQTTFILRYVSSPTYQEGYIIQEHFIELINFTNKTGAEIEELTFIFLESHDISISNCRCQGYDNNSNMAG